MQWKKPGKPNPFLLRHFNVNMKIHICFTIAEDETTAIIVGGYDGYNRLKTTYVNFDFSTINTL